ncbi:MAG: hypothetical protein SNJ77_08655 [Cytophagales bacterium]
MTPQSPEVDKKSIDKVHFEVPKEKIKIPSLKDIEEARDGLKNEVEDKGNLQVNEPVEVIDLSYAQPSDVDEYKLNEAWEKLKEHFSSSGLISLEVILNRPIEKTGIGEITLTLENEILKDNFDKNRSEIHRHFRKFLNSGLWNINAVVGKSTTHFSTPHLLTQQEKMQLIIDKYPAFDELRKVLGLELES